MSSLTRDLNQNRVKTSRYKRFIWPGLIFLFALGFIAAGIALYDSAGKEETRVASFEKVLPGEWLMKYFGTDDEYAEAVGGPHGDPDGDLLTNLQEFYFDTDPTNPDSDGDGQYDGAEVMFNSNPLGDGELFATEYSKSVVNRFLELHELAEFKEENVNKFILDLFNPPSDKEVVYELTPADNLKIIDDESNEAAIAYLQSIEKLSRELALTPQDLPDRLQSASLGGVQILIGDIYTGIDRLRAIEVPKSFVNFHQLQIASLFAAARIFEQFETFDQNKPLEEQRGIVERQYYQVAVIQKLSSEMQNEVKKLSLTYGDLVNDYR